MASFFELKSPWFHCLTNGPTCPGASREINFQAVAPGFLRITRAADGVLLGFGLSIEDDLEPKNNKIQFFERLPSGGSRYYRGQVIVDTAGLTTVQGKFTEFGIDGSRVVPFADDWTANRPTA